ncbi:universal stress protein [Mucilaginibacter sp. UR6-11]|uniref:universal stress protein n=1 Tax=Mucilaginibacter sp. UR6-11 TaxID=1435644 RepID=UPI001E4EE0A7|nr:universal stress protein [Mucilaginibacter sp. UR6-11]MCC8425512.1 universal stress protein [Mucilaginibacter sp. UR6-11]
MKTLLIATDLSENARHAATYGYHLAQQLKAKVLLCHVMNVPAEIPQTGMVPWPADVYEDMLQDSDNELAKLKCRLIAEGDPGGYQPEIICVHEAGFVTDVVNAEADAHRADMILIGMHGNDGFTTLMIGNHSRKMIDSAVRPLLLIPADAAFKPIKKIAFASDFKQPGQDIKTINELVAFARPLGAELVLAHIDQRNDDPECNTIANQLLTEITAGLDHQEVSYQVVKSNRVEDGLSWLVGHAHIDLIAMAHRDHGFFDQLFKGSHTQKAAGKMSVPLLVINRKVAR